MALVLYQGPPSNSLGLSNESKETTKFIGLSNQGATCYLNGLLQTLFMTPEFRNAVFTWNYNAEKDGKEDLCIPLQLQRLFGLLQLSKQRAVDTVALTKSFGWEGSEVFQQQDVQELTRVLFDALEESFKGTAVENIIDELYAGELVDYLRCIDVDYQSERTDKFLDFSLAIVPFGSNTAMHSLTECIEMFLRPEILNGDNKYFVESVGRKVDAIKGLKFGRLPQIMSVQLKRFVYDFTGASIVQKKLNEVVRFPMILDMNKYVATTTAKKAAGAAAESGNNETNPEFEAFLSEQLALLQQQSGAEQGDAQVESDPASSSDEEDGEDVPDLVDYTGETAPDQQAEEASRERREKERNLRQAAEEKVVYGSMDAEAVRQLLELRGEWIYELYAVLIHSGAISGGHYYAYIKDVRSEKWFDFNDSSVTPIDEKTVQETWGQSLPVHSSASYLSHSFPNINKPSTRLSSANAYMLMYRKVRPDVQTSFPPDEAVPQYIRELVQQQEESRARRAKEEEELRNRLKVRVFWQGKDHFLPVSRQNSLRHLMSELWGVLDLAQFFRDIDGGTNEDKDPAQECIVEPSPPLYERFRLRNYNQVNRLRTDAFDYAVSGSKTLGELQLSEYRSYVVETRGAAEEFEVYHADGISLLLEEFNPESGVFREPRSLRVPRTCTLLELRRLIAKSAARQPMAAEEVQVMKFVNWGMTDAKLDVLLGDDKLLQKDFNIYDTHRLFFEQRPVLCADETPSSESDDAKPVTTTNDSPAFAAYLRSRSRLEILVNKPPGTAFEHLVSADMRWTVQELRRKVLEVLEWDAGVDIRLFKLSSRGQELKDGDLSLSSNAVYSGCNMFVSLGKATPQGCFQLSLVEFIAPEMSSGVVALPELEPEDPVSASAADPDSNSKAILAPDTSVIKDKKKDWAAAAVESLKDVSSSLNQIRGNEDFFAMDCGNRAAASAAAAIPPQPPLPPLVFAQPASSSAAATSAQYRMSQQGADDEDDASDGLGGESSPIFSETEKESDVLLVGAAQEAEVVQEGEAFHENILNLVCTKQLQVLPEAECGEPCLLSDFSEDGAAVDTVCEEEEEQLVSVSVALTSHSLDELEVCGDQAGVIELPASAATAVLSAATSQDSLSGATCVTGDSTKATDDMEPSGFGELTVKNQCLPVDVFHNLDALSDIFAHSSMVIQQLRQQITDRLISIGKLPIDASASRVRIREKLGNNPGRVLRDGKTLAESRVHLFDNKAFVVQLLSKEEALGEEEPGDVLVLVQRWNRRSWTMGERFEVLLKGSMSVRDVARTLGKLTQVPIDSMLVMVVPRDTEILLSELTHKSPSRNYGRSWFDPSKELKQLKFMSHSMRLTDGDLVLLQDYSEPLRELSRADLRSIAIVEAASRGEDDVWMGPSVMPYTQAYPSIYGTAVSSHSGGGKSGGSNGIRIKTHQERLREETAKTSEGAAAEEVGSGSEQVHGVGGLALFEDLNDII